MGKAEKPKGFCRMSIKKYHKAEGLSVPDPHNHQHNGFTTVCRGHWHADSILISIFVEQYTSTVFKNHQKVNRELESTTTSTTPRPKETTLDCRAELEAFGINTYRHWR
jgi:hypothetical protein